MTTPDRTPFLTLLPLSSLLWLAIDATAQTAPLAGHTEPASLRSGNHANPSPVDGVVFRDFVTLPAGTPWLRLCFGRTFLSPGSSLRLVALLDGDVMTLNQQQLEEWGYTSAYFNGHAVMVELIAGPGTAKNYVEVDKVVAGERNPPNQIPEEICGPTDERQPTIEPRVGRLMPGGCTAWIAHVPTTGVDRCHLSAGHCFGPGQVLQFDVPRSAANCSLVHPPAWRQFAVDSATSRWADNGVGDDWWVFRCHRNPVTGFTTWETQGAGIGLGTTTPPLNTLLRITGYGLDGSDGSAPPIVTHCGCSPAQGTGSWNQTLQHTTGPLVTVSGNALRYQIDTCGGNSGSPVTDWLGGTAVAIHTHGGCGSPVGTTANHGTRISHPALQAGIAQVCSTTGQPGTAHTNAFLLTAATSGPFVNNLVSSLWPATPLSVSVTRALWFRYRTGRLRPEALYTFSTCSATRTLDTVLEVFRQVGDNLVLVAGNDDACGTGSLVTVDLQPETTYFLRVGGKNGQIGAFDLDIVAPYPANNHCDGALPLRPGRNGEFHSLGAGTGELPWACGTNVLDELWFVMPPAAANIERTFSTCDPATNFDTVLEILDGPCHALVTLACNDDYWTPACASNWQASTVTVTTPQPTPLYVRVGGNHGSTGTFALTVQERPIDDDCWQALPLVTGWNGPFGNGGATTSPEPWPCGLGGNDVWLLWTPTCSGQATISTCSPRRTFDTVLEAFSGPCGSLVSLTCNDDAGGACGTGSMLSLPAVANQPVWIRLGGYNGATGIAELLVDCTPLPDECAQAVAIVDGTNGPFQNGLATTSVPLAPCGSMANDLWFVYVATCTAPHVFTTCTPARTFDTVLEVLQGDCVAPWTLGCNDDGCDGLGSRVVVPLVQGTGYLVRVGGFAGATGQFELVVEPGTGTGSIATVLPGCGAATLSVQGQPRIGGSLLSTLGNVQGLPFLGLGFLGPMPFCGCWLGHDWASVTYGTTHSLAVPCDPAFLGAPVRIQGVDLFGSGGCASPPIALSPTVVATIG
ncbi:MAG: hypothetical protein IPK26_11170 [Planctomycetes bacterium]|nr:hypothetical protein [Planctomycetota bacterium]